MVKVVLKLSISIMSTFEEETSHTNIAKTGSFVSYLQNSDKVQDSCKKQSLLVKQNSRNDIVTKTLMSQSKVLSCQESCLHKLPRGSFLIMRVLWDKKGEKFHDHLCCVDWVCGYQIKLIFITDIYEPLSRSRTKVWDIQDLNLEAKRGNLRFIKFSLGSFGDEVDIVLERARNYEVPSTGVELLHCLRTCAFGLKEPIYSKELWGTPKISKESKRFQKVPKGSKKIPKESEGFPNNSKY